MAPTGVNGPAMETNYILGIDLGTSGVKAGLLNLATLQLECVARREYPDFAEQDPEVLWGQTMEAVKETTGRLPSQEQKRIQAVGLSGQMHGAVLSGAGGGLISPIINWKDEKRSSPAIVEKVKRAMGGRTHSELGTDIASGFSGAILFGIKENDPDLFRQIAHFVLPTDFLRGRLLGENSYATDPTNAFGTGLFNTQRNRWHGELIRKLNLPLEIFPMVHDTAEIAGEVDSSVGQVSGLPGKIPVIYGGGDNPMSMLGSGLVGPASPILINVGTAAQISRIISRFQRYPGLETRSFFNGSYALVGTSLGGGGSYKWLREQIIQRAGEDLDYRRMDELASQSAAGADGLVFCTGPSRENPLRRRGFYGYTNPLTSLPHLTRAVLEGVLMDLYDAYEVLRRAGSSEFMLGAGRGLQKSRVWGQISADLFGMPVRISDCENAVMGAALLAARGVGRIQDLESGVRGIECGTELHPEGANTKFYQGEFVKYWHAEVGSDSRREYPSTTGSTARTVEK